MPKRPLALKKACRGCGLRKDIRVFLSSRYNHPQGISAKEWARSECGSFCMECRRLVEEAWQENREEE